MKKTIIIAIVLCLCAVSSIAWMNVVTVGVGVPSGGGCPAGTEDFSSYTEVDANSKITVDSNCKLSFVDIDNDEDVYAYADKTAGYFSGDFTHTFEFMITAHATSSKIAVYGLSNILNDETAWGTNQTSIVVQDVSGTLRVYLYTPGDSDVWVGPSQDIQYYVTVTRDDDGGDGSGSVTAVICTGSYDCGTPADTLSCTNLTSQDDYQYVYGVASRNDSAGNRNISGYVQNLDLN